jgi:NAD(P)-dependent dehydrogenase (short-subunit alcohol dehydrogenase family)
MLLQDRVAVIYGAGRVGGAVARQFASEGATVFVTGREWWPLELVAKDILAAGGYAEPSVVDAFDEEAVDKHLRHHH